MAKKSVLARLDRAGVIDLLPGNRILALTSGAATLRGVVEILTARGYAQSLLTVLENLGGADERVTEVPMA